MHCFIVVVVVVSFVVEVLKLSAICTIFHQVSTNHMLLCKLSNRSVRYKCNLPMFLISYGELWWEICIEVNVSCVPCSTCLCVTSISKKYHNGNIEQHLHDLCSRILKKPSLQVSEPFVLANCWKLPFGLQHLPSKYCMVSMCNSVQH